MWFVRFRTFWKQQRLSLSDLFSSSGMTVMGCICLLFMIDNISFSEADPFSFCCANYSFYPPYSGDRGRIDVRYDRLHSTQFVRGIVTLVPNSTNFTSLISIVSRSAGSVVHSAILRTNITDGPFEILNLRDITFDSISVTIDSKGSISSSSFANVRFDFGSVLFFYHKLLIRVSFFFNSVVFLWIFLPESLFLSFPKISRICLLAFSILSTNPVLILVNTEATAITDVCFRRLLLSSCKAVAAVQCLRIDWSVRRFFLTLVIIYFIDIGVGVAADVRFAVRYFRNPLVEDLELWGENWAVLGLTAVEGMMVLILVFWVAPNGVVLSVLAFAVLCGTEGIVIASAKDCERGLKYLVGIAIPNLFACDYIREQQKTKRSVEEKSWQRIEQSEVDECSEVDKDTEI
jgi:hypothetical protein